MNRSPPGPQRTTLRLHGTRGDTGNLNAAVLTLVLAAERSILKLRERCAVLAVSSGHPGIAREVDVYDGIDRVVGHLHGLDAAECDGVVVGAGMTQDPFLPAVFGLVEIEQQTEAPRRNVFPYLPWGLLPADERQVGRTLRMRIWRIARIDAAVKHERQFENLWCGRTFLFHHRTNAIGIPREHGHWITFVKHALHGPGIIAPDPLQNAPPQRRLFFARKYIV